MVDPVRQEVLALAHTIVLKVGTNLITHDDGRLNMERLEWLAAEIHQLCKQGRKVALVSSGAIGAGMGLLGLEKRPTDLRKLQAAAAVGQSALIEAYEKCLRPYGYHAAQILLTASDFDHRGRYLNMRNTLMALFEWGCVPIINENDTVSVAEIRFGDNDTLAAMVTNLLQAPLLILLTVVEGLYTSDPRHHAAAELLRTVASIDDRIAAMASDSRSTLGSGGMRSKLKAARLVTLAGEAVIIANGERPEVLEAVLRGEEAGTLFLPQGGLISARKRWIGLTAQPKGSYVVDPGARKAIVEQGRSLLAIGVIDIKGSFLKGDVVTLIDEEGNEFARGLSNYPATDAVRVLGLHSEQIAELLGNGAYEEVIHRDNLAVTV
jgi:glutamate 5-kinase